MKLKALILVPAALAALALAGCSDDSSSDTAESSTPASATTTCPKQAPAPGTKADWTLQGATGSIDVVGPTADSYPLITVKNAPFTVDETTVKTLTPGTGADVTRQSAVVVCYTGVNGRDGTVFDSAFQRGKPAPFRVTGVVPGFTKALVGQKVGATVAVAMTSAEGYADGNPDAGIEPGDTLVFALSILDAA